MPSEAPGVGKSRVPGKEEKAFAPVRGAEGGSGKHIPLRIEPARGKVVEHDVKSAMAQGFNVFDEDIGGVQLADEPREFKPQTGAGAFADSGAATSTGNVLAGETAHDHINRRQTVRADIAHVLELRHAGPVATKNGSAKRVGFDVESAFVSRLLQPQIETANARKKRAEGQHASVSLVRTGLTMSSRFCAMSK